MNIFESILIAACLCSVVISSPAFAHAHPARQAPVPGAVLKAAPNQVVIEFDEALEPAFSSIVVTDAQRKQVNNAKSVIDPSHAKIMKVTLGRLAAGMYTVVWVAAARDGHQTQGEYTFTVKP